MKNTDVIPELPSGDAGPVARTATETAPTGKWRRPRYAWRPLYHRYDLGAGVYVGSGGYPPHVRDPRYQPPLRAAPCAPYGGECLGDGCIHWFPLPSPERCQEATCALFRDRQPIALPEARRRVRQNIWTGNDAVRLGWHRSGQINYQRAWAWALTVEELLEADGTGRDPSPPLNADAVPGTNPS